VDWAYNRQPNGVTTDGKNFPVLCHILSVNTEMPSSLAAWLDVSNTSLMMISFG
jgi:hypothetical protein